MFLAVQHIRKHMFVNKKVVANKETMSARFSTCQLAGYGRPCSLLCGSFSQQSEYYESALQLLVQFSVILLKYQLLLAVLIENQTISIALAQLVTAYAGQYDVK